MTSRIVSLDKKQSILSVLSGMTCLRRRGEEGGKITVLKSELKQARCLPARAMKWINTKLMFNAQELIDSEIRAVLIGSAWRLHYGHMWSGLNCLLIGFHCLGGPGFSKRRMDWFSNRIRLFKLRDHRGLNRPAMITELDRIRFFLIVLCSI